MRAHACFALLLADLALGMNTVRTVRRRDNTTFSAAESNSTGLGQAKVLLIRSLLNTTATTSWEVGTKMQTFLEHDYPSLSVYTNGSMPPPSDAPLAYAILSSANDVVSNKPSYSLQLVPDSSAGDPASIGIGVVLANFTVPAGENVSSWEYATAAADQIQALLVDTPRASDGAISHRTDEVALWADFVYMAPPFLAYYGVMTKNTSLLEIAYQQCSLYRTNLRVSSGLWNHIVDGSSPDENAWATGNGWASAGMLRVAVTMMHSPYASTFASEIANLTSWSAEIVKAAFELQQDDGFFPNYFYQSTFTDAASAALLASVSYRLAYLNVTNATLPAAEITRQAVYSAVSSKGVLSPVVNPLSYGEETYDVSPEGEAFVLLMESAWRDWYQQSNFELAAIASAASTTTTPAPAPTPTLAPSLAAASLPAATVLVSTTSSSEAGKTKSGAAGESRTKSILLTAVVGSLWMLVL